MKKIYIGIFALLCVAVMVVGGVIGALSSASVQEKTGKFTGETVADLIGLKADIGSVRAESFRSIIVENIVVYDKNGEVMLQTPEAEFTLRLLSFFTERPTAVVETITVKSPVAYLTRRESGEINISDINVESEGESTFKSRVVVENGTVYGDYSGKKLKIEEVNGNADIDGDDISYDVRAKNFDCELKVEGEHGKTDDISVDAKNIDIKNYNEFLDILKEKDILTDDVSIMAGVIPEVSLKINRDGDNISLRGKTEIAKGVVRVFETFISDIEGKITFSDKEILIDAQAAANGQEAKVAGSIDFSDTPVMDLAIKSDALDISEVLHTIPFKGAMKVNGKVTGTFANPVIFAEISQERGEVYDVVLKDTSAKARIYGKKIYVDEARTKVFDGEVFVNGSLDTSDLSYIVHAKGENLRTEYATNFVPEAAGLYGNASFDLNVHGKSNDLKNLSAYGTVKGTNLNYQNIALDRINASFYGNGGDLNIDYASAILANNEGEIGVEGKILPGAYADLAVYGKRVGFKTIAALVPAFKGEGFFDVTAKVTGALENPNLHFRVSSIFGSIFGQKYESMRTVLSGSLARINIDEFIFLKDGKKYWGVSGFFGVAGEKPLNIDVVTDGARLESIVNLFSPDVKLTGNLKNTVTLRGTLDKPSAKGRLNLFRGSFNGMLIQNLDLDYIFDRDILTVERADLKMPLLDLDAKGSINLKTEAMDFDVVCNDIDMMRLQHKFPYKVAGHGEFTGKIMGTISNPAAIAKLTADDLEFNGVTLTDVRGAATFKNSVLTVENLSASSGTGSFIANILADFKNNAVSANCALDDMDIESLVLLAGSDTKHLKGTLTAKASTRGTLKEPQTVITGVIPKGTLAGYPIKEVALEMAMSSKSFEVRSFKGFEGENGEINGSVSITPKGGKNGDKGGIKGDIVGKNIDFGLFTNLASVDAEVIGKADITAKFGGDFHNPIADISLEVRNGGIQGSTFDTLTGNLSLDSGALRVKDLVVNKNVGEKHYSASAKGVVPLKAVLDTEGRNAKWEENPKNSMDLTLHLDDANLSLIPALSKAVEWAEGETDGTLKLTGSLIHPFIHGNLKVENGALKIKAIRKPITNINFSLVGKGRDILLENFSGNMGTGNYVATGKIHIADDESLRYNFDINLNALKIDSDYYSGPLSGKLNVSQDYTGRPTNRRLVPKISGNISSEYAQIVIPVIPESDTPTPEVLLNLDLIFGKRVHLYEPQFYDMYFSGTAHFGGSTIHPASSGTIEVKRGGTIKVSHNTFRINAGEVIFNQTGTFLPSVKFFATTHVGRTKIYVALMGPLGTDKIKPYLTSSPSMSQTEIIRLLTLGTDYQKDSNGTDEVRGLLIAGLHMTALSGVERELKKGLSLDAFSLAYGSGSTFPRHREKDDYYSITAGKYISDKWLLRYNQGLGTGTGNYLVGVTYEMDDRTGIILEHVDGANIVGIEGRIRF